MAAHRDILVSSGRFVCMFARFSYIQADLIMLEYYDYDVNVLTFVRNTVVLWLARKLLNPRVRVWNWLMGMQQHTLRYNHQRSREVRRDRRHLDLWMQNDVGSLYKEGHNMGHAVTVLSLWQPAGFYITYHKYVRNSVCVYICYPSMNWVQTQNVFQYHKEKSYLKFIDFASFCHISWDRDLRWPIVTFNIF